MKALRLFNRVESDNHIISLFYRLGRRVREQAEKHWPSFWISRNNVRGVESCVNSESSIKLRFEQFADNCPFTRTDFSSLIFEEEKKNLEKRSKRILNHTFDLLGSGPVFFGRQIPWHCDFVTGYQWDARKLYNKVRKHTPPGSDIKRPWELSRCQHLVTLGLAWRIFKQRIYAEEYVSEIQDWIDQNSVGHGVNWACPMDAAIRAVNWIAGYALFVRALSGKPYLTFRKKLTISLWKHARFIRSHLEWNGPFSERRANHFLSNLAGLFTLGIFFKDTCSGRRWLRFSHKWLEREIRHQVFDDGVHFECTTSYHRLCLEIFLWCYFLGTRNNLTFSGKYKNRLDAMRRFVGSYSRPDGMVPLFGDNDDGRFITSGLISINDHRYLWQYPEKGSLALEASLLSGNDLSIIDTEDGLNVYKNSGFCFIRRPDAHLAVRAGRLSHLGVHAHCDQLSFELSINDEPIFIDRGSFIYTSDPVKRNIYRSSRAHNILTVNDAEQNRISGEYFGILDDTRTQILCANERELILRHTGFKGLNRNNIAHIRVFRFPEAEQSLEIIDLVHGVQNGDTIRSFFHLAPGLKAGFLNNTFSIQNKTKPVCEMWVNSKATVQITPFAHSPSYGRLQKADTLVCNAAISNGEPVYSAMYRIFWKA